MVDLSIILLRWIRVTSENKGSAGSLSLPLYLNSTRTELLFTVDLIIASGQIAHSFYERGVALLSSTALN